MAGLQEMVLSEVDFRVVKIFTLFCKLRVEASFDNFRAKMSAIGENTA